MTTVEEGFDLRKHHEWVGDCDCTCHGGSTGAWECYRCGAYHARLQRERVLQVGAKMARSRARVLRPGWRG